MRVRIIAALLVLGGCHDVQGVQCTSGLICPSDFTCSDDGQACIGPQTCGNAVVEGSEACDDGNTVDGDACAADCLSVTICGDGVVGAGETCDDGGTDGFGLDGDGCSSACSIEEPAWSRIAVTGNFPSPRYGFRVAYQPNRGRTLLFGGHEYAGGVFTNTRFDDTWEWDGEAWIERSPPQAPPARDGYFSSWDGSKVLLFGGESEGGQALGDTWLWDGEVWTEVLADPAPPPRRDATGAYDAANGRVILFGGDFERDVWAWDGTGWTQLTDDWLRDTCGAECTQMRIFAGIAYDPMREAVVLSGGHGNGPRETFNDVWELEGETWSDVSPAVSLPARWSPTFTYLPEQRRPIIFGGEALLTLDDSWAWDGVAWEQTTPTGERPARSFHTDAYFATSHRIEVFGGIQANDAGWASLDQVWGYQFSSDDPNEECLADGDEDGDSFEGCDDPDCWSYCTPSCPPGATCDETAPRCGDGACNPLLENDILCPADCP